ncbi:restriction endonuclease [Flavobacterium agricola]|uniref:Restriction endonuclease n=2 Tax=Flavobacterium agricola TaxID=2870839 RepID=A0ABY6M5E0_9FLAO|nr:restriction endonuclease [Flavobacterium agricola]
MHVVKYSGEEVPFNSDIFKRSILKSGATQEQVNQLFTRIEDKIYDGITTQQLYVLAFNELYKLKNSFAARYSLKKALRELGPEGYFFEDWVGKLFAQLGYQTTTGKTLQGEAVTHEVDVIAIKNKTLNLCECKFRNDVDAKISVTTPMYFLSRFNDLKNNEFHFFNETLKPNLGWVITNAYFTQDAIAFANHYGVKLLSWDYPEGNSIKNIVDQTRFYPITCLTTLTDYEKKFLLNQNVVLVNDICKHPDKLAGINFTEEKVDAIIKEAKELISFNI